MTPQQRWNAKNRDKIAASVARHEVKRQQRMRDDPEFREKRLAEKRAYYRRHKDERLACSKAWAERNREKVLQMAADRYSRTDARRRFAWHANRKVAKYGRPEDRLNWEELPAGPWTCHACGTACESWDHLEPLALGGANQPSNLVPSCVPCNQRRTAKLGRAIQMARVAA